MEKSKKFQGSLRSIQFMLMENFTFFILLLCGLSEGRKSKPPFTYL